MAFPSEREMRVRFHHLRRIVDQEEAKIKPLRDKYDKITQDYHAKIEPIRKELREKEAPVFDLKNEMGMIVRALGGKTALQPGDE